MKSLLRFQAAVLLGSVVAGSGRADLVSFQEGVNGYFGTQDVMVISHQPDTNDNGESIHNDIDNDEPDKFVQPLLQFNSIVGSSTNQIPAGSRISSATLTLEVFDPGSGVFVHRILEPWNESSTFNSLINGIDEIVDPPDDGLGVQSNTEFVPRGPIVFDVTSSVVEWVEKGENNYGWVLAAPWPNGTNGTSMRSSEYVVVLDRPILAVEFQRILGDMDINGNVDFDDIDEFVLGLTNASEYFSIFGVPPTLHGDIDKSGFHDFDDIDDFVAILIGSGAPAGTQSVPEPSTLMLFSIMGIVVLWPLSSRANSAWLLRSASPNHRERRDARIVRPVVE